MKYRSRAGGLVRAAALVFLAVVLLWLPGAAAPDVGAAGGAIGLVGAAAGTSGVPGQLEPGFVRIQVVANSDSTHDQQVKGRVRDSIRGRLGEEALGFADASGAMARVEELLPELAGEVSSVLAEDGCGYSATVSTGEFQFPPKSYGGVIVPAGTYPALRVTLGQGRGSNWWCVLFPPLCFVDIESSLALFGEAAPGDLRAGEGEDVLAVDALAVEHPGDVETVQAIANALRAAEQGGAAGAGRPQLRSWLWEKLRGSWLWRWVVGGAGNQADEVGR